MGTDTARWGLIAVVGLVALVAAAAVFTTLSGAPADGNVAGGAWRSTFARSCTDSDGENYESKGTVTVKAFGTRSYTDRCVDAMTLREYVCNGNIPQAKTITCAHGCDDGVCVQPPGNSAGEPLVLRGAAVAQLSEGTTRAISAQRYYYPVELVARPVLSENGKRHYLLTSASTDTCVSDKNFLTTDITFTDCSPSHVSEFDLYGYTDANGNDHLADRGDRAPWRRNYGGVMGAAVTGAGADRKVIGVVHGENQNAMEEGIFYPNTVRHPISENTSCYSSSQNGWQHCWESFSSFVSLVWWPYDEFTKGEHSQDLGPIIWNPRPYSVYGGGPYHPTLFTEGSSMYVYYNLFPVSGNPCNTAARATIGADGMPGPFKNHAGNGRYPAGRKALPDGLTPQNVRDYYNTTIPYPKCLVNTPEYNGVWFSVARIKGTPYYLSAEERISDAWNPDAQSQIAQVVIRISDDPGNWTASEPIVIEEAAGGWGALTHTYPTFVDKDGTTTMEIDPAEFYLIGDHPNGGYLARATRLSLDLD